jgi:hypothetical protein
MKDIEDVPEVKELDKLPHIPDDDKEGPHFVNVFDESKLEQLIADAKAKLAKMDEPHEPYTQRFDKERATKTLDKILGKKGEKK